jgi:hypothetical protein
MVSVGAGVARLGAAMGVMNEFEGWAAGEASAQRAATGAGQHLRAVLSVVENAEEEALRTSGTRSGPVGILTGRAVGRSGPRARSPLAISVTVGSL